MIKKLSILFTILFAVTLFSCKQTSDEGGGGSFNPITKTYLKQEEDLFEVAAILELNGIYSISFGLGINEDAANNNIISGLATKNGNTYTCSNLTYNSHLPTSKPSEGTLTITVNGTKANVVVENCSSHSYLNGNYELTEYNN